MKLCMVVVQFYANDKALARYVSTFCGLLGREGIELEEVRVDIRDTAGDEPNPFPFMDISGYIHGLAKVPAGVPVLVLNDTYFVKHPWRSYTKSLATVLKPLASLEVPCAAGAVFPTQSLLLLDESNPTRRHVCTFLVAFNAQGREVMDALARGLPGRSHEEVKSWLDEVMSRHRALHLMCRLHFADIPNPWGWPGLASRPGAVTIQRKTVTVAFEYLLSYELLRAGGMVLPINAGTRQWFAEQVERLVLRLRSLNILRSIHL